VWNDPKRKGRFLYKSKNKIDAHIKALNGGSDKK
jgi:hypothetical protein